MKVFRAILFLFFIGVQAAIFAASVNQSEVKITFVGTGSCLPMPQHKAPCNLLTVEDKYFLVDSGAGSLQTLAGMGIEADAITAAFYTHFHIDHIGDLVNILTWYQVYNWTADDLKQPRRDPVFTIYGPVGIKKYIQGILPLTPSGKIPENVMIVEVKPDDIISLNFFSVKVGKVPHTLESVGYRFTFSNGKVIAITGDTGTGAEVVELIKNADVAVLECSYDDAVYQVMQSIVKHLGPTVAGQLAEQADVKTLVLTHFYPSAAAVDTTALANNVFSGKVISAVDGVSITL